MKREITEQELRDMGLSEKTVETIFRDVGPAIPGRVVTWCVRATEANMAMALAAYDMMHMRGLLPTACARLFSRQKSSPAMAHNPKCRRKVVWYLALTTLEAHYLEIASDQKLQFYRPPWVTAARRRKTQYQPHLPGSAK